MANTLTINVLEKILENLSTIYHADYPDDCTEGDEDYFQGHFTALADIRTIIVPDKDAFEMALAELYDYSYDLDADFRIGYREALHDFDEQYSKLNI